MIESGNINAAWKQVKGNKGAAGVDGLDIERSAEGIRRDWDGIKAQLLAVARFIRETLNPLLRGWMNYFRLSQTKGFAELLDGWVRRRLRGIIWRQWKRPATRYRRLCALGLDPDRAHASASNGRGSWFNSGASHMNHAYPKATFDALGLLSLSDLHRSYAK